MSDDEEAEAQFSRDVDDNDPDMPPPGGGIVLAIGVIVATWAGKLLGR